MGAPVAAIPDALLGDLYQTLAVPALWPGVVRDLIVWTGGVQGALQIRQLSPELQASMITAGVEPEYHEIYLAHYYKHDPHLAHAAALTEGSTHFSRDMLPDEEFAASSYFNEFCRPQGTHDLIGAMLLRDEELAVTFAAQGSASQRFEEAHLARLQKLVPHLTRVMRLTLQQERQSELIDALGASERVSGAAVLCVDAELQVRSSSPRAAALLAELAGMLEIRQNLLCARGSGGERLKTAVRRALTGVPTGLELPGIARRRLLITPAAPSSGVFPRRTVNVILLPSEALKLQESSWLCELPPSLRRVASLMASGAADKEIADELGMSLASARTYATRVLKRLRVHSRRDLMRLMQSE